MYKENHVTQHKADAQRMATVLCDHVRHIRFAKTYKPEVARLEVGIVSDSPAAELWKRAKAVLGDLQFVQKQGIAPRSNLERQVQEAVDKMEGGKKEAQEW